MDRVEHALFELSDGMHVRWPLTVLAALILAFLLLLITFVRMQLLRRELRSGFRATWERLLGIAPDLFWHGIRLERHLPRRARRQLEQRRREQEG
jgi:hypothetical protein